jgi:hypothetical protein
MLTHTLGVVIEGEPGRRVTETGGSWAESPEQAAIEDAQCGTGSPYALDGVGGGYGSPETVTGRPSGVAGRKSRGLCAFGIETARASGSRGGALSILGRGE